MHLLNSLRKLKLVQIHNQGDLLSIINQTKLSHRVACIRYNATSIFALASGANQRCGVAVVSLSGRATLNVLLSLSKSADLTSFEPRRLYLRNLWHPVTHEKIDRAIVVWFKGNNIRLLFKCWNMISILQQKVFLFAFDRPNLRKT